MERLASFVDELRKLALLFEDSDSDATLLASETPAVPGVSNLVGVN